MACCLSVLVDFRAAAATPASDRDMAARYEQSAQSGDDEAQFYLGALYSAGVGRARSDTEAFRWIQRAANQGHPHAMLIEGNDGRHIDVAVMSRCPFERVVTHQALTWSQLQLDKPRIVESSRDRIFKRDCLEVHVQAGEKTLPVFVCHFKSMDPERERTRPWRECEATAVRRVIEKRFDDPAAADWVVVGDLNDYTETDGTADDGHGLAPLLGDGFAVDAIKRIRDPKDRWTHFYPEGRVYRQLDYVLLSPALARKNPDAVPAILRQGLPYRAERYQGPRYPRIGWDRPKASDHCPIVVDLTF